MFYVPVVDLNQKPLMPTHPNRAATWIKSGKATPFWKKGVFCVRLNVEPSDRKMQDVVVGIDPGSKKESFTVKSEAHTYLNVQTDAVTWLSPSRSKGGKRVTKLSPIQQRRMMRRTRRSRKNPCRKPRSNRSIGGIPPSTKARWQWKLRIVNWLGKMYPISTFVVEDIKTWTKKGQRKWNKSFSPLEVGKQWFYQELGKIARVELRQGRETKELRDDLGLKKLSDKMSSSFYAHCVDSWVLANGWVEGDGHLKPDNTDVLCIVPLRFHRRQLHRLEPKKGGIRSPYGGTISLGFKRGSLIRHPKYGIAYIGGTLDGRISLHSLETGKRLCQNGKPEDCSFLCYSSWRAVPNS